MSSPTFNTTADFVKSALFEEYYDSFNAVLTDSNWSLTHLSLFAKNVDGQRLDSDKRLSDHFMKMKISQNDEYQSNLKSASSNSNQNEEGTSQKKDKQKANFVE
ncbi:hypothetical protein RclHR1_30030002 [Rhizophagus clarus]|uniref:Uncharacterized protein n=1 Tax=Rhizophagus clarus TaxID=94130 RepID=A0A2Z6RZT5_9GLOM|nr:hypothetical protein RclHR1_30030002 [Rhizophagus clarus]